MTRHRCRCRRSAGQTAVVLGEVGGGEYGPRGGRALPPLLTHGLALPACKTAAREARLGVIVVCRRLCLLPGLRLTDRPMPARAQNRSTDGRVQQLFSIVRSGHGFPCPHTPTGAISTGRPLDVRCGHSRGTSPKVPALFTANSPAQGDALNQASWTHLPRLLLPRGRWAPAGQRVVQPRVRRRVGSGAEQWSGAFSRLLVQTALRVHHLLAVDRPRLDLLLRTNTSRPRQSFR